MAESGAEDSALRTVPASTRSSGAVCLPPDWRFPKTTAEEVLSTCRARGREPSASAAKKLVCKPEDKKHAARLAASSSLRRHLP